VITVQTPAAIRACSPVVGFNGPDVVVSISGEWAALASDPGRADSLSSLALIISDPTGAAHLAWWLQKQPKQAKQAAINALQIKGLDLLVVAEQALNGMPIDDAGLTLLRDYALRVVSNG